MAKPMPTEARMSIQALHDSPAITALFRVRRLAQDQLRPVAIIELGAVLANLGLPVVTPAVGPAADFEGARVSPAGHDLGERQATVDFQGKRLTLAPVLSIAGPQLPNVVFTPAVGLTGGRDPTGMDRAGGQLEKLQSTYNRGGGVAPSPSGIAQLPLPVLTPAPGNFLHRATLVKVYS